MFGKTNHKLRAAERAVSDLKAENAKLNYELKRKEQELESARATVYQPVIGVSEADLDNCNAAVAKIYSDAHKRQKSKDAKPTDFMKGVKAAMDVFSTLRAKELI